MKKVLYIGDGGAPTGFATVNHNIISNLDLEKYEIHHLAINYRGDPHPFPWRLYPAEIRHGDYLGMTRIPAFLDMEGIFILNDPWVINDYLIKIKNDFGKNVPPVVVYFPVDALELHPRWFANFDIVKKICVYTEFAKTEVLKVYETDNISVIPHGIDSESFYKLPMPKPVLRRDFFPEKESLWDSFIVLNANRNQPRKRIDLTMEGFKLFSDEVPDSALYLHMGTKDVGWDIIELGERLGIDSKLILTSLDRLPQSVPIQKLNRIYNLCDVGLNTAVGEGWSLTNMEHAVTGAVQVLPNHSALAELYSDCGILLPVSRYERNINILTLGGVVNPGTVASGLQMAYENRNKDLGRKAMEKFTSPKYQWTNIVKEYWSPIFEEYFL